MKNLKAKATVLAFLKGAPVPPNDIAARIALFMCGFGFNGNEWGWDN